MVPLYGGIEVSTSSTALASLTDCVLYLYNYHFECTEQLASRILAVVSMKVLSCLCLTFTSVSSVPIYSPMSRGHTRRQDVLHAFDVEGTPTEEQIRDTLASDFATLVTRQHGDGGFGFWDNVWHTWNLFLSCHAAHAMARSLAKDIDVPRLMVERAQVCRWRACACGGLQSVVDCVGVTILTLTFLVRFGMSS